MDLLLLMLEPWQRSRSSALAEGEGQSLSSLVRRILAQYLETAGSGAGRRGHGS